MKQLNLRKTLLGVALLGSFAAPLATSVAQAAPPNNAPAYGRRAKDNGNNGRGNRNRNNDRYDRNRYDGDRDYRDRYDRDNANDRSNATYTGTVTNVRTGNSFDLSANGRTYNVYTTAGVPRGLSRNDQVRVSGRLYGDNDIRNANVSIVNNQRTNNGRDNVGRNGNGRDGNYTNGRYDPNGKLGGNGYGNGGNGYGNNGGGYGNGNNSSGYQTYTGVVTKVSNDREFDVRVGGTTYNVYASSSTRGLNKNDTVRIYGQRFGDNDIRNAQVNVTRDNGNNNNNDTYGRYENFTGVVTKVSNDREFNVRIGGTTYNVYASSSTRGLKKNDEVSIYGQRFGVNDIRNANARITRSR